VRVRSRDATFRVYLAHPDVRSMGETFGVYLLHLNNRSRCHCQARTSEAAAFRMYFLHLDSMRNEHEHVSTHNQPMCMALTLIRIQTLFYCQFRFGCE
jgi:hypothetical protein